MIGAFQGVWGHLYELWVMGNSTRSCCSTNLDRNVEGRRLHVRGHPLRNKFVLVLCPTQSFVLSVRLTVPSLALQHILKNKKKKIFSTDPTRLCRSTSQASAVVGREAPEPLH